MTDYPPPPFFPESKVPQGTIPGPARRRIIDYIKAVMGDGMEWVRAERDDVVRTYYHEALLKAGKISPSTGEKIGGILGGPISAGTSIIGGTISVVEFLGKLSVIFTAEFWLRFAEVAIGALMVGVGLAHLSTHAESAIRSIPGYGAAIGKAMAK